MKQTYQLTKLKKELKERCFELSEHGKHPFKPENIDKSKVMQDRISEIRREIRKMKFDVEKLRNN
jgi:hypothetical protein